MSGEKKRMAGEVSRRLSPNTRVPSRPAGRLRSLRVSAGRWAALCERGEDEGLNTHGRRHNRQVKKTVKRLLYLALVLLSAGRG